MSIGLSSKHFLTGPQNFNGLKYWANDEPGFMTGLCFSQGLFQALVFTTIFAC